jgi:hypothetical protein
VHLQVLSRVLSLSQSRGSGLVVGRVLSLHQALVGGLGGVFPLSGGVVNCAKLRDGAVGVSPACHVVGTVQNRRRTPPASKLFLSLKLSAGLRGWLPILGAGMWAYPSICHVVGSVQYRRRTPPK